MRVIYAVQNLIYGIRSGNLISLLILLAIVVGITLAVTLIVNIGSERRRLKNPPPKHTQYRD